MEDWKELPEVSALVSFTIKKIPQIIHDPQVWGLPWMLLDASQSGNNETFCGIHSAVQLLTGNGTSLKFMCLEAWTPQVLCKRHAVSSYLLISPYEQGEQTLSKRPMIPAIVTGLWENQKARWPQEMQSWLTNCWLTTRDQLQDLEGEKDKKKISE